MEQLKKTQRCLLHVDNRPKHRTGWRSWESCFITLTNINGLWVSSVSCRQKIPPRQIRILCMILSINFWTLLTSDFHSLPSYPHRSFRCSSCWWMGCCISLIRYASWGLKARAVCSRNKAAEPFTVESQRPSRVSVTAWSGKVMSPPSNAGSRPQHPKLISWIWLCPSTFLCFYRSFPRPNLGSLFSCFGTYSMFHLCSLSSHRGMLGNSQAYLDHSAETGRERIQAG